MITPQYLLENVKKYPNENALSIKDNSGNWKNQSWKDFHELTDSISKSLFEKEFQTISISFNPL